jgi:hypothetical protein
MTIGMPTSRLSENTVHSDHITAAQPPAASWAVPVDGCGAFLSVVRCDRLQCVAEGRA